MLNLAVCYSTPGLASFLDISGLRGTLFQEAYALGKPDLELIEVNRICIVVQAVLDLEHGSQQKLGCQKARVRVCLVGLLREWQDLLLTLCNVLASNMSTVLGDAWSLPLSESVDHVNNRLLAIALSRVGFL